MGVLGVFCQVCGLPVHHDHYVAQAGWGFKIYRGARSGGGHAWEPDERPVRFGPEHAWLARAVGVPGAGEAVPLFQGPAEDGVLVDTATGKRLFVGHGDDDGLAYHAYCHALAGRPTGFVDGPRGYGTHPFARVEPYQGQLFDLRSFVDDGWGWALVDPTGDSPDATRSRTRIEVLLAELGRHPAPDRPPERVADLLRTDRGWRGRTLPGGGERTDLIRYREDLVPAVDRAGYPALLWLIKEYGGDGWPTAEQMQALDRFEGVLKPVVESGDGAILVLVTVGRGQAQFLVYARDEDATRARIDALPGRDDPLPAEYSNELDPEWRVYFEQMDPHRYLAS